MIYRELLLGCGYRRQRILDPYPYYQRQARLAIDLKEFATNATSIRGSDRSIEYPAARIVSEEYRWQNVVTVDFNPDCEPDLLIDLSRTIWSLDPPAVRRSIPEILEDLDGGDLQLRADTFDEIHAYEVFEHIGRSGDYETFFAQFDEIWRMLKPGGFFCATVPSRFSIWAWGDPGHTRIINPATLIFLHRPHYSNALGNTPSSDYRSVFSGDFNILLTSDDEETFSFILQAVKPARKA
jgi:SAM-dependent methyltransferase